jgi:hypothetical protein
LRKVGAGKRTLARALLNLGHQLLARGLADVRPPAPIDLFAKGRQRRDVQRGEDVAGGKSDQRHRTDPKPKGIESNAPTASEPRKA